MTRKAMALDLSRCAGCGGCVVACQMQNNTRPGVVWGSLDRLEWGGTLEAGAGEESGRCYLPHSCMQCDAPLCVAACPTGASVQQEDGVITVTYEDCICCGACVTACPYGARHINKATDYWFGEGSPAPYEAYGVQRSDVAEKCIFCYELVAAGGTPACVANCPGKARTFGDADDPASEVAQKIAAAGASVHGDTGFYYLSPKAMPEGMILAQVAPGLAAENK